eukprot:g484.t1
MNLVQNKPPRVTDSSAADLTPSKTNWLLDSVRADVRTKFRNLREAFLHLDSERNGFITREELRCQLLQWNLPARSLDALMKTLDCKGNRISYQDFVRVMRLPGATNGSDEFITTYEIQNAAAGASLEKERKKVEKEQKAVEELRKEWRRQWRKEWRDQLLEQFGGTGIVAGDLFLEDVERDLKSEETNHHQQQHAEKTNVHSSPLSPKEYFPLPSKEYRTRSQQMIDAVEAAVFKRRLLEEKVLDEEEELARAARELTLFYEGYKDGKTEAEEFIARARQSGIGARGTRRKRFTLPPTSYLTHPPRRQIGASHRMTISPSPSSSSFLFSSHRPREASRLWNTSPSTSNGPNAYRRFIDRVKSEAAIDVAQARAEAADAAMYAAHAKVVKRATELRSEAKLAASLEKRRKIQERAEQLFELHRRAIDSMKSQATANEDTFFTDDEDYLLSSRKKISSPPPPSPSLHATTTATPFTSPPRPRQLSQRERMNQLRAEFLKLRIGDKQSDGESVKLCNVKKLKPTLLHLGFVSGDDRDADLVLSKLNATTNVSDRCYFEDLVAVLSDHHPIQTPQRIYSSFASTMPSASSPYPKYSPQYRNASSSPRHLASSPKYSTQEAKEDEEMLESIEEYALAEAEAAAQKEMLVVLGRGLKSMKPANVVSPVPEKKRLSWTKRKGRNKYDSRNIEQILRWDLDDEDCVIQQIAQSYSEAAKGEEEKEEEEETLLPAGKQTETSPPVKKAMAWFA